MFFGLSSTKLTKLTTKRLSQINDSVIAHAQKPNPPERDLNLEDALLLLGIAYYQRLRFKDLKACHKRLKRRYQHDAHNLTSLMFKSQRPLFVFEIGVDSLIKHREWVKNGGDEEDTENNPVLVPLIELGLVQPHFPVAVA